MSAYWLAGMATLTLGFFFLLVRVYALLTLARLARHYGGLLCSWVWQRILFYREARRLNEDMDPRYRRMKPPPAGPWNY